MCTVLDNRTIVRVVVGKILPIELLSMDNGDSPNQGHGDDDGGDDDGGGDDDDDDDDDYDDGDDAGGDDDGGVR